MLQEQLKDIPTNEIIDKLNWMDWNRLEVHEQLMFEWMLKRLLMIIELISTNYDMLKVSAKSVEEIDWWDEREIDWNNCLIEELNSEVYRDEQWTEGNEEKSIPETIYSILMSMIGFVWKE